MLHVDGKSPLVYLLCNNATQEHSQKLEKEIDVQAKKSNHL